MSTFVKNIYVLKQSEYEKAAKTHTQGIRSMGHDKKFYTGLFRGDGRGNGAHGKSFPC